jgi:hypothetical protein
MDDSSEIERAKKLLGSTAIEEAAKRLSHGSLATELERLNSSSALVEAQKHLSDFQKLREVSIPRMPYIEPVRLPTTPTLEESNQYQSAAILLRRLAEAIRTWRAQLPKGLQPAVLALLHGGVQMDVEALAQESFHGIRIEGRIGGQASVVLAHQATVQLLCIAQPVEPPSQPRRPIGFVIDGQSSEA